MIRRGGAGHPDGAMLLAQPLPVAMTRSAEAPLDRLAAIFTTHYDFVWRSLRRLGVPDHAVDDATQEVFVVVSRRLADIVAGKEKSFLFGTAVRVAADARRKQARRREDAAVELAVADPGAPADEQLDHKRARALLEEIVAGLPDDTRPVFVLYELEAMTMAEIAVWLELPPGTVASRLRRAREAFTHAIERHARRGPAAAPGAGEAGEHR